MNSSRASASAAFSIGSTSESREPDEGLTSLDTVLGHVPFHVIVIPRLIIVTDIRRVISVTASWLIRRCRAAPVVAECDDLRVRSFFCARIAEQCESTHFASPARPRAVGRLAAGGPRARSGWRRPYRTSRLRRLLRVIYPALVAWADPGQRFLPVPFAHIRDPVAVTSVSD